MDILNGTHEDLGILDSYFDQVKDIQGVQKVYELYTEYISYQLLYYDMKYYLTTTSGNMIYRYTASNLADKLFRVTKSKKSSIDTKYSMDKIAIGSLPEIDVTIIDIVSLLSTTEHQPTIYSQNSSNFNRYDFTYDNFTVNDNLYVTITAGTRSIDIETDKSNKIIKKEGTLIDKNVIIVDVVPTTFIRPSNTCKIERYVIPVNGNLILKMNYYNGTLSDIGYIFLDPDAKVRNVYIDSDNIEFGSICGSGAHEADVSIDPDSAAKLFGSKQEFKLSSKVSLHKLTVSIDDFFNCNLAEINDENHMEYYMLVYDTLRNDTEFFKQIVFKIDNTLNIEDLVEAMKKVEQKEEEKE